MKSKHSPGNGVHGNEPRLRKASKHDANLRKNGIIRFQIGLLVSLATAYFVMEATFAATNAQQVIEKTVIEDDDTPYEIGPVTVEKEPEKVVAQQQKKVVVFTEPTVIDNNAASASDKVEYKESDTGDPNLNYKDIDYVPEDPSMDPIPVDFVEFVPVFPGCETLDTNKERKDCMSEKINRIVQKNFKTHLAGDYGLSGEMKIYVQFRIDKKGNISDVKVRAPHKVLEKEAERVTALIPQMKPGKQGIHDVEVVFTKPIIFKVQ